MSDLKATRFYFLFLLTILFNYQINAKAITHLNNIKDSLEKTIKKYPGLKNLTLSDFFNNSSYLLKLEEKLELHLGKVEVVKDKYRTIEEKIIEAGFKVEIHKIVTDDRYILTAFRIPGKLGEKPTKKPPATFTHGLLDSAYSWFVLNSTSCLPLKFAKEGYDVWVMNVRGNEFSLEHMDRDTHNSDYISNEFWNFSLDEIIRYDLIANLNYVKETTGYNKLTYIGHSQGTFIYFMGYTLYSNYFETTIEKFIGLGPAFMVSATQSPIAKFFASNDLLQWIYNLKIGNVLVLSSSKND